MPEATGPNINVLTKQLSPGAKFITPDHQDYASSLKRWADNAERKAAYVVQPAVPADVQAAIVWAQEESIGLAVCGGGHSTYGTSSIENGLVIDLCKMRKVTIDESKKLIHAQGGALWEDVDDEAFKYGLATVGGTVAHTGIGGLTLGGGYGFLSGQYGLVVDNLVEATVCTADGNIIKANESTHSDLFWALRGGGGNFGVVVEFVYKAHPIPKEVWGGFLIYTPDKLEELLKIVNSWLKSRSEKECALLSFGRSPHHNFAPVAILTAFYNGPAAEGEVAYKEFLGLGPVASQVEGREYPAINKMLYAITTHGDRKLFKSASFRDQLNIPTWMQLFKSYCNFSETVPDALRSAIIIDLFPSGQTSKVSSTATAFANRSLNMYGTSIVPRWKSASEDQAVVAWANDFVQQLIAGHPDSKPDGVDTTECVYGNNVAPTTKSEKVFRENYPRLRQVKGKYDPKNVFNRYIPIEPLIE